MCGDTHCKQITLHSCVSSKKIMIKKKDISIFLSYCPSLTQATVISLLFLLYITSQTNDKQVNQFQTDMRQEIHSLQTKHEAITKSSLQRCPPTPSVVILAKDTSRRPQKPALLHSDYHRVKKVLKMAIPALNWFIVGVKSQNLIKKKKRIEKEMSMYYVLFLACFN